MPENPLIAHYRRTEAESESVHVRAISNDGSQVEMSIDQYVAWAVSNPVPVDLLGAGARLVSDDLTNRANEFGREEHHHSECDKQAFRDP
jgi:hypothetical protein